MQALIRPRFVWFSRSLPAFQVCGYTGLIVAALFGMLLAEHMGRSVSIVLLLVSIAVATFFALAFWVHVITGRESLVYFQHIIAILLAGTAGLGMSGRPVLPYLDLLMMGIGSFSIFGRTGCLMAGCCHGKPCRHGISYGNEHAAEGFPTYFMHIRLLPVPLIEAVAVLLITTTGTILIVSGAPPGTALVWYIVTYSGVRFGLEFLRGDPERPYFAGFSEAQWTALVLTMIATLPGVTRIATEASAAYSAVVGTAMLVSMIAIASARRFRQEKIHLLLHPRHVQEVAEILHRLQTNDAGQDQAISVFETSAGLRLSGGRKRQLTHITFSWNGTNLSERATHVITGLIVLLERTRTPGRLQAGSHATYHFLYSNTD